MDNQNLLGEAIKFVALGGLNEMGKNCYILEVNNDAFIIEAGSKHPNQSNPGIDTIIPDFSYIYNIKDKIKGIIITHGHDDQYGSLAFLLSVVQVPVYATATTIQMIKHTSKINSKNISKCDFRTVKPNETINIAGHIFDLFETTHSVPESFGFVMKSKLGNIVYTSDYITDYSPLSGYTFDLQKVALLAREDKTFLLLTESEGADKPGIASPKHKITNTLIENFEDTSGKILVSLYTQNFFNIQELMNVCTKFHKKLCVVNQSDEELFIKMNKLNSLDFENNLLINLEQIKTVPSSELVILCSGNGEELYDISNKICYNEFANISINREDLWINCAQNVSGVEKKYITYCDNLYKTNCKVIELTRNQVTSMHAQQEDLKMMISIFRPQYYIPLKGDFMRLLANAQVALDLHVGLNHSNTLILENGSSISFNKDGSLNKSQTKVKCGDLFVDGGHVGEVKENSIDERTQMNDAGVIVVGCAISLRDRIIKGEPDIQVKGFLHMKDNEILLNQTKNMFVNAVKNYLDSSTKTQLAISDIEQKVTDKVSKFIEKNTSKNPLVMVDILNIDDLNKVNAK